ncbi:MAG: hypothetical protein RL072_1537 [Actinomycetota bacterium]|jgi:putative glycosyltransferase (TIGR04372 family)
MIQRQLRLVKTSLSKFLSERSVVRHHQYPTRANTLKAVLYMLAAIPFAVLILPFVALRAMLKGSWKIHVLATEGEFGPFVQLMEVLRSESQPPAKNDIVMVLSRRRHALCDVYESELGWRVMTGAGAWMFVQQAILLQPRPFIAARRLTDRVEQKLSTTSLRVPENLVDLRKSLLRRIGADEGKLVLMALNVRQYDEENNPQYLAKELALESVGEELTPVVDYFRSHDIPLMMVGSADTGRAKIPREIPRLVEFGQLGGPEEVALASICRYFWTDNVGAWWLAAPFKRPVLFTNFARFKIRNGRVPAGSMCLPTRYETHDGTRLTFRDILAARSSPYKAASRGELRMTRNSPDEIIDAHQEMIRRLDGSWCESDEASSLAKRYAAMMSEYPKYEPWRIPTAFLSKHSYLLD